MTRIFVSNSAAAAKLAWRRWAVNPLSPPMMTSQSIREATERASEEYCYLTTIGRVSGREHVIEIWFALSGSTILMMSGNRERSHWVQNAVKHPRVTIRLGDRSLAVDARIIEDPEEEALARRLLRDKYYDVEIAWFPDWLVTALPVAFDLV